jgi:hypothetical protein
MGAAPDYRRKHFGPLLEKNLRAALAHCIAKQFPRVGGARMCALAAEMVLEVLARHLRPRAHIRPGQVLWLGIHRDDPPARGKRIGDMDLVPVVLDLSLPEDVEARLRREPRERALARKAIRLCEQAFAQNALLSNVDLAELLNTCDSRVAQVLSAHEEHTGRLVPRRATLHDVGTGLTHKRLICRKRYLEGKEASVIASETYHSLEAVDRYLGQYDRVRHCRQQGFTLEQSAYVLGCSRALVREYWALDEELEATK